MRDIETLIEGTAGNKRRNVTELEQFEVTPANRRCQMRVVNADPLAAAIEAPCALDLDLDRSVREASPGCRPEAVGSAAHSFSFERRVRC
jgi:hypothetical protein